MRILDPGHGGTVGSILARAIEPGIGLADVGVRRTYDPSRFILTLWTDDPILAERADQAGIDRIGLDLEIHGKLERQPRGLGTWISPHRADRLPQLREAIDRADLFCRVNPINPGSRDEIEEVLDYGVEVLMLPMFTTAEEVATFVDHVDGRARCVLLLENTTAADRVDEIVRVPGVDEVHVGLNDLTLSLGDPARNRFAVLADDLMERIADAVHAAGLRFGVGGVGRVHSEGQTIPGDLIHAQYPRLGASAALIARSFLRPDSQPVDLPSEIRMLRQRLEWWRTRPSEELEDARRALALAALGASW